MERGLSKSLLLVLTVNALLVIAGCGGSGHSTVSSPTPPPTPPAPPSAPNTPDEWTWMSGSDVVNQKGVYGAEGSPGSSNTPGGRTAPSSWTDTTGNLWLFGGYGYDSTGTSGDFNDLWRYSSGGWAWMGGSNLVEAKGVYGTKGIASSINVPGGRYEAASWTDASGNFWLFGGLGLDATGTRGDLNDLWKYSGGRWTWMSGPNTANQSGVYGVKGAAAPDNMPGARVDATTWADSADNLWLFGGGGYDSNGTVGILNDLWEYSGGKWTWVSGSNTVNHLGVYGTKGTAALDNVPGSRTNAMSWIDKDGNFWLFGGQGNDSNGIFCSNSGGPCFLNDLWKYSGGEWTWMAGSSLVNEPGTYGTKGIAAPDNIPGARLMAVSWKDTAGNVWLLGGRGFDSTNGAYTVYGDLNDLWKFSDGQWTWMAGSNLAAQPGSYGTQGTPADSNTPGARSLAVGWIDQNGNLWLFGGNNIFSMPYGGHLNDLWVYHP